MGNALLDQLYLSVKRSALIYNSTQCAILFEADKPDEHERDYQVGNPLHDQLYYNVRGSFLISHSTQCAVLLEADKSDGHERDYRVGNPLLDQRPAALVLDQHRGDGLCQRIRLLSELSHERSARQGRGEELPF